MIHAKWLFEHHLQHSAMAKHLKNQIETMERAINNPQDAIIATMALTRPPLDSPFIRSSGQGSPTERIALQWREKAQEEAIIQRNQLQAQLNEYEYYLSLFDSVISAFPQREKWLIENYFIQCHSLSQIVEMVESPYYGYSKPTICRHKNRVLKKADDFLHSCFTKGEYSCRPMKYVVESLQSTVMTTKD